ncbi:MAG: ROK family glucokinase, partial [Lachnospiraceae bacterium]|nr:ROK family glucokinase [Lachnospiraceae bacterium]
MKEYVFGADLGGTTCKLGLFKSDGSLMEKWEIPTDTSNNGANILRDISEALHAKLTEKGIAEDQVEGVGLGIPGPVNEQGVVNRCVNLGWGVIPIEKDFANISGFKVKAGNDANVAAMGEAFVGAGKGAESVVMITLGTGVGAGIILDGKIIAGHNGAAGEFGHIKVVDGETETCGCGKCGCLEQYASATGVVRLAKRALASSDKESALRNLKDDELTAKDVFDEAKAGDELAKEIIHEFAAILGSALAKLCTIVNPEMIVIGGGVSKAGKIILDELDGPF